MEFVVLDDEYDEDGNRLIREVRLRSYGPADWQWPSGEDRNDG